MGAILDVLRNRVKSIAFGIVDISIRESRATAQVIAMSLQPEINQIRRNVWSAQGIYGKAAVRKATYPCGLLQFALPAKSKYRTQHGGRVESRIFLDRTHLIFSSAILIPHDHYRRVRCGFIGSRFVLHSEIKQWNYKPICAFEIDFETRKMFSRPFKDANNNFQIYMDIYFDHLFIRYNHIFKCSNEGISHVALCALIDKANFMLFG